MASRRFYMDLCSWMGKILKFIKIQAKNGSTEYIVDVTKIVAFSKLKNWHSIIIGNTSIDITEETYKMLLEYVKPRTPNSVDYY